jgi:hypothetical protein
MLGSATTSIRPTGAALWYETGKVDKAFRKTEEFKNLKVVGASAYQERLTGGFRRVITNGRADWKPLAPGTIRIKERKATSVKPWIWTGETIRVLSDAGRVVGRGKSAGQFKPNGAAGFRISNTGMCTIRPVHLSRRVGQGKSNGQNSGTLWGMLNFSRGGSYEKGKRGSGQEGRGLGWKHDDMPLMEPNLAKAIEIVFRDAGLGPIMN